MVEHHLAKVGVASSNLVFRSNFLWRRSQAVRQRSAKPLSPVRFWVSPPIFLMDVQICRGGGTGRRKGLKIPRRVISVPVRFRSPAPFFIRNIESSLGRCLFLCPKLDFLHPAAGTVFAGLRGKPCIFNGPEEAYNRKNTEKERGFHHENKSRPCYS